MGEYHVEPEEGHTYWYKLTTGQLSGRKANRVPVEIPDELVNEYGAAQQEVDRLDELLSPYAAICLAANECVVCGRPGIYHYGSEDHDLDPVGLRSPSSPGGLTADTGADGDVGP